MATMTREEVVELLDTRPAGLEAKLQDAYLTGLDLSGLDFSGLDLSGIHLCRANLANAKFNGASLRCADLSGASLFLADLREADLRSATLVGATIYLTLIGDADFSFADLRRASLLGSAVHTRKAENFRDCKVSLLVSDYGTFISPSLHVSRLFDQMAINNVQWPIDDWRRLLNDEDVMFGALGGMAFKAFLLYRDVVRAIIEDRVWTA